MTNDNLLLELDFLSSTVKKKKDRLLSAATFWHPAQNTDFLTLIPLESIRSISNIKKSRYNSI